MDRKTVIDNISSKENDIDVESKIQGEYNMPGTTGYIPTREIKIQQVESVMMENSTFSENRNENFNLIPKKEILPEEPSLSEASAVDRTPEKDDLSKEGEEEGSYHTKSKIESREQSSTEKKSGNRKYIIIAIIILILLLTKCLG